MNKINVVLAENLSSAYKNHSLDIIKRSNSKKSLLQVQLNW